MLFLLFACEKPPEEVEDPPCGGAGDTYVLFMNTLVFTRRTEEGQVNGFNLDNHVSTASDSEGCGKEDLTSPLGVEGIDSSLSALVPAIEATEAAAVEGLIQASVNSGEILVGLEIFDVDDPMNDSCVNLRVSRAMGSPSLGTDGLLEAGQTYDRDPEQEAIELKQLALINGRVEGGPFEWSLPIQVLDAQVDLLFHDAWVHASLPDDEGGEGFFAGGLEVAEIIEFLGGINSDVGEVIGNLFPAAADLKPDDSGACQQLSAGLDFTTTTGFFFAEDAE